VLTLTNKLRFREFLRAHGLRSPRFAAASNVDEARDALRALDVPVLLKRVDSSGSKGVSRVADIDEIGPAFADAVRYSRDGRVIIEEWIERSGRQIAGDGLVVDGRLVFGGFGDEHFDPACSPLAPVGESYPGELAPDKRALLMRTLQRVFELLGVQQLVFNLDAMFDTRGELLVIEIGPRAGGNALPQLIHRHTGVDLTDVAIKQALGLPVEPGDYAGSARGYFASHMLHARQNGTFCGFRVDPALLHYTLEVQLTAPIGTRAETFGSSKDTLGFGLFGFPDNTVMQHWVPRMSESFTPLLQ
jgi:biotin carboxylase